MPPYVAATGCWSRGVGYCLSSIDELSIPDIVAVASVLKKHSRRGAEYPYTRCTALFSPAERSFLGVLEQAVGQDYRVFGKVRVADIIEPRPGLNSSARQIALNRTSAKHFDFIL